jgi:hypothetical protein
MRRGRSLVVLLFLGAFLASAGGCLWDGDDDESDELPFPSLTPFPDDLEARLHEIRDRIAGIRGLEPYDEVEEGTISRESLEAYSNASFDELEPEDAADLEAYEVVLKLLGVIEGDVDLQQIYSEEFSGIIAGLYVPEDESLVLIGAADGDIGVQDEITLGHEYVHSFQDGVWGINELSEEFEGSDLEEDGYAQYSETLSCLIEGDASLADEQYAEEVFGPNWFQLVAAETPAGAFKDIEIPEFLGRAFSFNYSECPEFVRALHGEGGWPAVDDAYDDPPDTTEQVMHPDKYREGELANTGPPVNLGEQLGGWRLLDDAQFGEFDVYNWAVTLTHEYTASRLAGAGWGSGWVRSYRDEADPSRAIVQLSLGWDSRDDLLEFLGVYDAMLAGMGAEGEAVSEGNVRWKAPGQEGVLFLDDVLDRIEIRVATDAEALKAATADLPQFN